MKMLCSRVGDQCATGNEGIHFFDRKISKRILRTLWIERVTEVWKPRSLLKQMAQGDLLSVARRQLDRLAKIFRRRIIRLHFSALNHVLQQKRGEGAGHGVETEHRIA